MVASAKKKKMASSEKVLSALDIARYFIWRSQKEGKPITNKKLQKLLYYAQAWNLVFKEKRLFKEDIEAWIHGPTVPVVYQKYKKYGYNPILEDVPNGSVKDLPSKDVLSAVWEAYGKKYDAKYLEALTHSETPWQIAREGITAEEPSSVVIDLDTMRKYYLHLLKTSSHA